MNDSLMESAATSVKSKVQPEIPALERVDMDTAWSLGRASVPCVDLAAFGQENTIHWIRETCSRLNWREPRIVVIGPRKATPSESNAVRHAVTEVGAIYYERSANQSFDERREEVQSQLSAGKAKGQRHQWRPLAANPSHPSDRALAFYASDLNK